MELLEKHSKNEDILERLDYLNPKPKKQTKPSPKKLEQPSRKDHKYCTICEKMVWAERDFNTGALLILLVIGIIPGLIYYAVKNKTCPICKHANWGIPPED